MITMRPTSTFHKTSPKQVTDMSHLHVLRQTMNKVSRGGMFALAGLLSTTSLGFAQVAPGELPMGGSVASGSANFDYSQPNHLEITQGTHNAVFDWDSFNIGQAASTNFNQTQGASSIAVNRVHDGSPSQILGSLTANGNVIVLNQNGVFFGNNAHVDVGGLIASTGELDFDAFTKTGAVQLGNINAKGGSVINKGHISVKDGGLAAFVAPNIVNDGIISAKLGKIALAAGANKATVDLYGDGLVELALDDKTSKALITNTGTLKSDGGTVAITVAAAKDIANSVINMGGVVEANTVGTKGGKIILGATNADIKITGKVNAKGGKGSVKVATNKNITVADTAVINADAGQHGDGGTIAIIADKHTDFRGSVFARGGSESGHGGFAEISGYEALGYSGYADLSAANGAAGTLLLDPTFAVIHSGALHNPLGLGYVLSAQALANSMENATNVVVQASSFIDVGTSGLVYNSGNATIDAILNGIVGTGDINLSQFDYYTGPIGNLVHHTGTTLGSITLQAGTVNINKNVKMGSGNVAVNGNTINLFAKLYGVDGTTLLNDPRLSSNANFINVKSNAAAIQQALDWASDTSVTRVNVAAGTYNETLAINKNLILYGANKQINPNISIRSDETILHSPTTAITVNPGITGGTIDGFTIEGGTVGVFVNGSNSFQVNNHIIKNTASNAIYFSNSDGNLVYNNKIMNTGPQGHGIAFENGSDGAIVAGNVTNHTGYNGIYSTGGLNMNFHDNTVTDAGYYTDANPSVVTHGISIENGSGRILNNVIDNAAHGILVYDATGGTIVSGNTVKNTSHEGIIADNAVGTIISGNIVYNTAMNAISVIQSASAQIIDNAVGYVDAAATVFAGANNIQGDGIFVSQSNDVKITGNDVTDTQSIGSGLGNGIHITNSNNAVIGGTNAGNANSVKNIAWDGINVSSSDGVRVIGNTTDNVARVSIYLGSATNSFVRNNTVTNGHLSGYGSIHADFGSGLTISSNTVDLASGHGIGLYQVGGKNKIDGNIIKTVAQHGIYTTGTQNIKISGNQIGVTGTIGQDGIYADGLNSGSGLNIDGTAVGVYSNAIDHTAGHGVQLVNATGSSTRNITVNGNLITNSGLNGVFVNGGTLVSVVNNAINAALKSGVQISNVIRAAVTANAIDGQNMTTDSGVRIDNSSNITVGANLIQNTKTDGIRAFDVSGLTAGLNVINNIAGSGIGILNSDNANLTANLITNTGRGFWVGNSDNVRIRTNVITNSATNGIMLLAYNDGLHNSDTNGYGSQNAVIAGNIISGSQYGINVVDSNDATIGGLGFIPQGNTIVNASQDGVYVANASGLKVVGNSINTVGRDGVSINNAAGALIALNGIGLSGGANNIGNDGVQVINSANTQINVNQIANAVANGIFVDPSDGTTIAGNTVTGGINGIYVLDSSNVIVGGSAGNKNTVTGTTGGWGHAGILIENGSGNEVSFNDVSNSNGDGIRLQGTSGTSVNDNTVTGTGQSGIAAKQSNSAEIIANTITQTNVHGVSLELSNDAQVDGNTISNTLGNGIDLYYGNQNAEIAGNVIHGVQHGIHLDTAGGQSNNFARIQENVIYDTGKDGIFVTNAIGTGIFDNFIGYINSTGTVGAAENIHGDGIKLANSEGSALVTTRIEGNKIANTKSMAFDNGSGVQVLSSNYVTIRNNDIDNVQWDGVRLYQVSNGIVDVNDINTATRVGVYMGQVNATSVTDNTIQNILLSAAGAIMADFGADLTITGNDIDNATGHGIKLYQVAGANVISDNEIDFVAQDGINSDQTSNTQFVNNDIGLNGYINGNGVFVSGSTNVELTDNTVSNVDGHGLYFAGLSNGTIALENNAVTSKAGKIGARFESGIIDLTSANFNSFNGGMVGLLFDPLADVNASGLELVDNTIGTTEFTGQTQYYVELENGAFFNPGTPTLMNGYNALFDGQLANAMSNVDYNTLLSKIHDYLDIGTVGLFFPLRNAADINDVLPEQTFTQSGIFRSPLLTITGLPFAPGARISVNALNQLNANALNNLASAAGGEQVGQSSQRAGQAAQFASLLNSVETSAGETTVGCWGGVYNSLNNQSATPVTYNFNASPIAQLADQASCGNAI